MKTSSHFRFRAGGALQNQLAAFGPPNDSPDRGNQSVFAYSGARLRAQRPNWWSRLGPAALAITLILAAVAGCESQTDQQKRQTAISESKLPDPEFMDENTIRASAKHYTNAQRIPGVGTAVGDVYVLPDGGCFGGAGKSGILYPNKNVMLFGNGVSARNPLHLFEAGSPATKRPGQ